MTTNRREVVGLWARAAAEAQRRRVDESVPAMIEKYLNAKDPLMDNPDTMLRGALTRANANIVMMKRRTAEMEEGAIRASESLDALWQDHEALRSENTILREQLQWLNPNATPHQTRIATACVCGGVLIGLLIAWVAWAPAG